MMIALVVHKLDPRLGGLARWVVSFAAHLAARDHDVHIVTCRSANHDLDATIHLVSDQAFVLSRADGVQRCLQQLRPDRVYDTGAGWAATVFHPHTGSHHESERRFVASGGLGLRARALLSPRAARHRHQMLQLEVAQLRNAARVVAVSHLVERQLLRIEAGVAGRMTVVYNGVDTEVFSPRRRLAERARARSDLGITDEIVFATAAYNFALKGVDTAMRATARLAAAGNRVRLVVAGGTPDAAWRRRARSWRLDGLVDFIGHTDDMAQVIAAADAIVHPTRWDACSLTTVEGMSAGLPVISTSANGSSELIDHGVNGYVLEDPNDGVELARCMGLLCSAGLRDSLGLAARRAVVAHDADTNFKAVESMLIDGPRFSADPVPAAAVLDQRRPRSLWPLASASRRLGAGPADRQGARVGRLR